MENTVLRIEHLRKEYAGAVPIKDLTVDIHSGDAIAIIGPSGTGKSTFLRMINMLEKPTSGKIFLGDTQITALLPFQQENARRRIGMVFQSYNLYPHLTVLENVMDAQIHILGTSKQEAYDKAYDILENVGMSDKLLSYPDELSGGQKQRVAIARTLAMDPEIILFDEPTSALDPSMVGEAEAIFRQLSKRGTTMMIVTHDMKLAETVSNRIFYMDEGGIYEEGTPEKIFHSPEKEKTIEFIRQIKHFTYEIKVKYFKFDDIRERLTKFAITNGITDRKILRLQLMLDELIQNLLIPALDKPLIWLDVEYYKDSEEYEITIKYNGPNYDVRESADDLAIKIFEHIIEDYIHWSIAEGSYTNICKFKLK